MSFSFEKFLKNEKGSIMSFHDQFTENLHVHILIQSIVLFSALPLSLCTTTILLFIYSPLYSILL